MIPILTFEINNFLIYLVYIYTYILDNVKKFNYKKGMVINKFTYNSSYVHAPKLKKFAETSKDKKY